MENKSDLSYIIRAHREKKGYTQEQLSHLIHKSDKYIGSVESGRVSPPYPVLKQIVQILEIDGNCLFYNDLSPDSAKSAYACLSKLKPELQDLAIELLQILVHNQSKKHSEK